LPPGFISRRSSLIVGLLGIVFWSVSFTVWFYSISVHFIDEIV
jgi:hypothetical protein